MDSILHKIRSLYGNMGPAERRVADYILEHPDDILCMSISELSALCECGDATLVRFSRRLSLDGFGMLKIGLAGELRQISSIGGDIKKDDSPYKIFDSRIHDITAALRNTETVLDKDKLDRAARCIMAADRIVIFGLGNSASVAKDAEHKFLRIGLCAQACTDNHMQAIIASHLKRGNVAIGISHSGISRDVVDALKLSKASGATTICITNFGKPPIVETSDIALFTKAEETQHSILAMSSRIAQLAILDSIYTYIVLNSDAKASREIFNTEFALQSKKI